MKFIERLKSILAGNNNSINSLDLEPNSNFQSDNSEEKELILEELYPNMTEDEIWSAVIEKDDEDLTSEEVGLKLGMTFQNEKLFGRSLAVKELVDNNYHILDDEFGNPFKELINFTLLYFNNYFKEKSVEANDLLKTSFPLMYQSFLDKFSIYKLPFRLKIILTNKKVMMNS